MTLIHISMGGPDRVIVDARYKRWTFEDHSYFGPSVTDSKGRIKDAQPREGSPFWEAVTHWEQQGKQVDAAGICVWAKPPKPVLVHLGGRNYAEEGSALALKYGKRAGTPQGNGGHQGGIEP